MLIIDEEETRRAVRKVSPAMSATGGERERIPLACDQRFAAIVELVPDGASQDEADMPVRHHSSRRAPCAYSTTAQRRSSTSLSRTCIPGASSADSISPKEMWPSWSQSPLVCSSSGKCQVAEVVGVVLAAPEAGVFEDVQMERDCGVDAFDRELFERAPCRA